MDARQNSNKESLTPLPAIPDDVWDNHIFSFMPLKNIGLFSLAAKPSTESIVPRFDPILIKFFKLVECGSQKSVKFFLSRANLQQLNILLCSSLPFLNRSGNFSVLTAWQLALCNYDHIIYQMMEKYFDELPNGLDEKKKQFKTIFPSGIKHQEKASNQLIENAIAQVIAVIVNDDTIKITRYQIMNVATAESLKEFCKFVKQHKNDVMTIYLAALTQYIEKFTSFKCENSRLFEVRVLGYLQGCLATGYLRIKGRGLVRVIDQAGFKNKILSEVNGCLLYRDGSFRNVIDLIPMRRHCDVLGFRLGVNIHIDMLGENTVAASNQYHINFFKSQHTYTKLMHKHAIANLNDLALRLETLKQQEESSACPKYCAII